ncbi:hypothetical protein AABB24_003194, partial [Solanum stoloniferum]
HATQKKILTMNSNTIPYSPPYYYQQDFALENNPHEYFSDSTIITTNTQNMTIDHHHHHQYSSQISENDDIHELISPKTTAIKPVTRRRSRASKKTPTTLLTASITNFRALVQQHTGCHTCPTFKNNQKGPINLSFGPPNDHDDQNELFGSNSIGEGSMNYGYYYNNHEDQDEKYSKDNLQQEKQESGYNSVNYENSKLSVDDYGW